MLALLLALQQAGTPAPDSAAVRREARELQSQFELFRREHLPISEVGKDKCEVKIGRFCYWYDPTDPPLPDEPKEIAEARADFLAQLENLARFSPTDPWVLAQRVRYTIEQGLPDSAVAIASCATWWCRALSAYAYYYKGDVGTADSLYTKAMSLAPMGVRCDWNHLGQALEPQEKAIYDRLDCRQRDSVDAYLFWRGRPAFSRGGNDVRVQWYARQTAIRAYGEGVTHHGMIGSRDYFEMLSRYGMETSYARRPPKENEEVNVVGLEPKPSYAFLAPLEEGKWPPEASKPASRFSTTRFAKSIGTLENVQLARFRRGDSLVVVAGFNAARDSMFTSSWVAAGISLSNSPTARTATTILPAPAGRGSLGVRGKAGGVVSVELMDSVHRAFSIYRLPVDSAPVAISDLLITVPGDSLPESLDDAAKVVWPGLRVGVGGTIGLYWETYGVTAADSLLSVTLSVEPVKPGFFGRLTQSIGLKSKVPPLRLNWKRRVEGGVDFAAHSVEVDLSRLKTGSYVVSVELSDGRKTTRHIEIIERPDST
ncbi:MAG TPA: hypothetical protein VJU15_02185 [Gemmatimonadales bacterium]|nr:hypothetical protein [Gemmatimonadales bacterium]